MRFLSRGLATHFTQTREPIVLARSRTGHRPQGGTTTFAESRTSTTLQGHLKRYPTEESNLAQLL